jgi:HK97 family phage prohead protease
MEAKQMPANTKDREYRLIEIGAIEAREEQNGEKIVEGYATTYNREYSLYDDGSYEVKEQIDRGAFDDADTKDTIMQYNHEGRVFARISNGTLQLSSDEHGLKIRANLGGTEIGRQLYEEIKGGYTTKMSFGFTVAKQKRTEEKDNGKIIIHRKITGIRKLYDVSAVSLPANDTTEISARNFSEGVIAEVEQERLAIAARQRKMEQIKITAESF